VSTDDDLRSRLQALARHRAIFEAPGFRFGEWEPSWTDDAGVLHLGWYRFSDAAEAFLRDASPWVEPFDWMTWMASAEGRALLEDTAAVAGATPEQLGRLLTTYVRGERFGDGTLAAAFDSGMLTAIVRRAEVLSTDAS
jgi:hypothetical protein